MSITMGGMIDPNLSLQAHTLLEIRTPVRDQTILEETGDCVTWATSLPLRAVFPGASRCISGEVSERLKEHAWKVCVRQKRTEGSNPSLSAISIHRDQRITVRLPLWAALHGANPQGFPRKPGGR